MRIEGLISHDTHQKLDELIVKAEAKAEIQ
jgi:hypothetical protein